MESHPQSQTLFYLLTFPCSPTRETGQLLLEGNTMMQKDMDIKEGHMGQRGHSPIPKDKSSVLLFGQYDTKMLI